MTDKHPPSLEKYDASGNEINEVVHHPGALETKRDLWENGFIGLRWTEEVRRTRAGHLPSVVNSGFSYFLSQAETGMLCAIGMTAAPPSIVDQHASADVRERFPAAPDHDELRGGLDGGMFLTEIRGGSDLAASECSAVKSADGWRVSGSKWFCSNLDAEAILHWRGRRAQTPACAAWRCSSSPGAGGTARATACTSGG